MRRDGAGGGNGPEGRRLTGIGAPRAAIEEINGDFVRYVGFND